jgi:hypothetical protein
VLISRPHNGAKYLDLAREHFPRARIVYDAEAVFCVREFLRAELEGRGLSEAQKRGMLRQELDIVKSADLVITVSERERDVVVRETGHGEVIVWGHARDVRAPETPFSKRRDLLFVGGFLHGHPPNTDAVMHFAHDLVPGHPAAPPGLPVRDRGRRAPGRRSPAGVTAHRRRRLRRCRWRSTTRNAASSSSPLRFGAGISLKLIEAMSQGIPAVVTTVGATGLGLEDRREALIARDDGEFVDKVVELYEDETLWAAVQRAAQDHVRRQYSSDVMRGRLAAALGTARGVPTP